MPCFTGRQIRPMMAHPATLVHVPTRARWLHSIQVFSRLSLSASTQTDPNFTVTIKLKQLKGEKNSEINNKKLKSNLIQRHWRLAIASKTQWLPLSCIYMCYGQQVSSPISSRLNCANYCAIETLSAPAETVPVPTKAMQWPEQCSVHRSTATATTVRRSALATSERKRGGSIVSAAKVEECPCSGHRSIATAAHLTSSLTICCLCRHSRVKRRFNSVGKSIR